MKVLITGGAGFLGINLVRHLLAQGHGVRSLDIAAFAYPERAAIDVVDGDIRDRATMEHAAAGIDVVVHAAAALPLYSIEDIFSTNVEGTRRVLEAAAAQRVQRVIFISSTAVYGIPDHQPIVEDDPLIGVGPYGESKIQAEAICTEFRKQGRCVPVLRPKTFVGPERLGAFELLYDWAHGGHNFPILGAGTNHYQLLDVDDLCRAIELCATTAPDRANQTFNVAASRFGTMRDDFQAVLDRAGHGKRVISIPAAPAIWTLRALEALRLSPLYAWIYKTATHESVVSIERIERRLGFTPRYSNRDALIRNFEWFVANRSGFAGSAGISHRIPWNQGLLRLAKAVF